MCWSESCKLLELRAGEGNQTELAVAELVGGAAAARPGLPAPLSAPRTVAFLAGSAAGSNSAEPAQCLERHGVVGGASRRVIGAVVWLPRQPPGPAAQHRSG